MKQLIFWTFLLCGIFAQADLEHPARTIQQVHRGSWETMVKKVSTARILVADYKLIQKDFPALKNLSHDQVDQWLLAKSAYISESQMYQTTVNTKIITENGNTTAYRPPDYNRALVFEVDGGLLDGKGFGSRSPSQADHGNGLATTGEMLREFLYQKMVQRVFDHARITENSNHQTVGSYAVIDWGFQVRHANGTISPAGAILRQAHPRAEGPSSLLDDKKSLKIEKLLRRFGITSAGAFRKSPTEGMNIQGTSEGAVIDFGAYLTVEKFVKPVTAFLHRNILLFPNGADFLQPDPTLRIPLELWGTTVSRQEDPKADNPWLWSHEVAQAFSEGRATRGDVDQHVRNLIDPVDQKLRAREVQRCSMSFFLLN